MELSKQRCEAFFSGCGICLRFKKNYCRPPLGNTIYRVDIDLKPFKHVSIDPLGMIRVKGSGNQTQRVYPLIMCCLSSGGVHAELMEAKDIYLALLRLQYRYHVRVTQIFSDKGSQIAGKLLGKTQNFYVRKLSVLWSVYNNVGHSQFRNLVERKIQTLKKMIKQGIFGTSGPQTESADRSLLETAISGAVSMINCVPYATSETNHLLLTPADTLTPWRGLEPTVQHLPKTKLRSLAEARRLMVIKQERMKEVLMENTRLEVKRFRAGNLKLGKNKSSPQIQVGSVVMLDFEDRPEYGAVISLDERSVRVCETAVGQCIPLTPDTSNSNTTMGAKTEEPFTHFICLEFNENELKEKFVEKIQKLQETLKSVENIGKAAKASSLHLTIATLNVKDGELDTVLKKAKTVHERFVDLLDAPDGLMVAVNQIGFGDYGALWVNLELGKEAIGCLREMIDESLNRSEIELPPDNIQE